MKKLLITNYISLKRQFDIIPLDTDENILLLNIDNFMALLLDFLTGKLNSSELEMIADLLESKDGVSFENEWIKKSIHDIANIDIQGIDMTELVNEIINGSK